MMRIKKIILYFCVVAASMTCVSCLDGTTFDSALLVGKWVSGTEYYRYDSDGSGATWDTGDDVREDEAQAFTWEFVETTGALTHIHQMEMGGVVPKSYTVTVLNDSELSYQDRFGQTFVFTRVRQ